LTMDRNKWLATRATPRHPETRRYVHVSTRYGIRVKSVSPYVTEFVKKEKGVTYRRPAPKARFPGAERRARLAREREGVLPLTLELVRKAKAIFA
jgi:hypothetical protein